MTRRASDEHRKPPVEVRLLLDPEDHTNLAELSKVARLATSQFARSIITNYLDKVYQPKDETP